MAFLSMRGSLPRSRLRAVPHFESLNGRLDSLITNPLVSMFTQDVPLGVMPYRLSGESGYDAKIVGADSEVRRATALLQSVERRNSHEMKELIIASIREIAQSLALNGVAPYEIWTDRKKEDTSEAEEVVRLSSFTPKRLAHFPSFCVQFVPRADQKKWGRSIVILPARKLWLVSMPGVLGGHRGYRKILRQLARFNLSAPAFWQQDLARGDYIQRSSFDFQKYRRALDVHTSRVTRKWGWGGRDTSTEKRTEFGLFYRIITFKWAQTVLREHIVSELNLLLRRLQINAEIQVLGLPSSDKILELRTEMCEGRISYTKVFEMTKM